VETYIYKGELDEVVDNSTGVVRWIFNNKEKVKLDSYKKEESNGFITYSIYN